MKILLDLLDLLDDPHVTGESVVNRLKSWGVKYASSKTIGTNGKATDFVSVLIPGRNGKTAGGTAPTLGIVRRRRRPGCPDHRSQARPDARTRRHS